MKSSPPTRVASGPIAVGNADTIRTFHQTGALYVESQREVRAILRGRASGILRPHPALAVFADAGTPVGPGAAVLLDVRRIAKNRESGHGIAVCVLKHATIIRGIDCADIAGEGLEMIHKIRTPNNRSVLEGNGE